MRHAGHRGFVPGVMRAPQSGPSAIETVPIVVKSVVRTKDENRRAVLYE